MADNVVANAGSGGSTFRSLQEATIGDQWPASVASYVTGGAAGAWTLAPVDITHGLPVQPMTGATWAATQSGTWNITNISGTVSLPTGASTAAKQPALGTAGTASSDVITIQGIASMTAVKVDGSGVTQPVSGTVTANAGTGTMAVSAASLPLPSGAATSAKQPALGTAGTASTDVISVQGIASMTALKVDGSGVTQPVSWSGQTVSITANSSVNVAQMNGVATTMGNGTSGTGVQRVTIASDSTGILQTVPGTTGGCLIQRVLSAATTNATSVKASAGQVYGMYAHNINASPRFLKLYNKASSPTVGTDTPVMTLPIPGNANGAGFVLPLDNGVTFSTGIALAITGAVTDADTTAIAANDVVVNLFYK